MIFQRQLNGVSKNIKPTFGISFGLPNQIGGGHPYPNPIHLPNFADPGQTNGINLGLVSVNPLVALQVSKNDYGEKIFKPFVNLHVTPNNFLVHKVQDFFDFKKGLIYNSHHQHYHNYKPHHIHKPSYHYEHAGPIFDKPPPYIEHLSPGHYSEEDHHYHKPHYEYADDTFNYPGYDENFYGRSVENYTTGNSIFKQVQNQYKLGLSTYGDNGLDQPLGPGYFKDSYDDALDNFGDRSSRNLRISSSKIKFPNNRKRRDVDDVDKKVKIEKVRFETKSHYLQSLKKCQQLDMNSF